jgi:hypothetical protein
MANAIPTSVAFNGLVDPAVLAAAVAFVAKLIHDALGRNREVKSVNTAVLAEVKRLLGVVKRHEAWWNGLMQAGDTTGYPLIPFSHPIYGKQVKNIGRLPPEIAGRIATFYGYIGFLNSLQNARGQYRQVTAFDSMYHESLVTFILSFDGQFDDAFAKFGL